MSYMSYCQFRNYLAALRAAERALNETGGDLSRLSSEEEQAAIKLINLCRKIGDDWGPQ